MPSTAKLMLNLFDGTRHPMPKDAEPLITLYTGHRQLFRDYKAGASIPFELSEAANLRAIVHVTGYRQSGFFPVKLQANQWTMLDLMLLKRGGDFNFAEGKWSKLAPELRELLRPKADYESTLEGRPRALATMLNILTATRLLYLLRFFRGIEWTTIRNDRFFAWVDQNLVSELESSARFAPSPASLHKGATRTFKQTDFNEANIQYSLHEEADPPEEFAGCVRVECDMDYYKDAGAHTLLEVVPNQLTGTRTNPAMAYMLRWMAGKRTREQEFAPPYVFE